MRNQSKWTGRALGAVLLTAPLGACDFIDSTGLDPNVVAEATVDQLFTGVQVTSFFMAEGHLSRLSSMWIQQMAGTDRQFVALDEYIFTESEANTEFSSIYTGGGLVDIRSATALADSAGRRVYAGILKIHEAFLIGMGASIFGDIPYSEAVDPDITEPKLDDQLVVHQAIQTLLDEAIADLDSGEGPSAGVVDMNFGGDATSWKAVAYTLKARFYIHWGEAMGTPAYQAALAAAQNGIAAPSGNWNTIHSTAAPEQNLWYQFMRDRSGYISAGDHLIPLMKGDEDPRISLYYEEVDGDYVPRVSLLSGTGYGASDFNMPIVSCSENAFIMAEALYRTGNEAGARVAARSGVSCQEQKWGLDLSQTAAALDSLSGAGLFEAIMGQKYRALFLNVEIWNDYKRTCLPAITPRRAPGVPGRLFYGADERQTNSNIPPPSEQPARNDNDPSGC